MNVRKFGDAMKKMVDGRWEFEIEI